MNVHWYVIVGYHYLEDLFKNANSYLNEYIIKTPIFMVYAHIIHQIEPAGYARDIFMTSRGHVMTSSRDLEMIRKITNTFLASVKILGQLQGCIIPLLKALFNAHLWWNSHYMYHASLYVKNCLKILFFHIFYTKSHFSHP